MKKQLDHLKTFHAIFGGFVQDTPSANVPKEIIASRIMLLNEECKEVEEAMQTNDLAHIAKELADVMYILLGTIHSYGLAEKFEQIFDEVHRSNMSKLTKEGKPLVQENGKVIKSDQYTPADIESILSA